MDTTKRRQLIDALSCRSEPQIASIDRFFDGNDDLGSIGCNLLEHPGIDTFRKTFAALAARPDVEAVYAQIAELDPGEGCWPFADMVYVAGTISIDELKALLAPLQPDEIGPAQHFGVPQSITRKHKAPILAAWWD